MSNALRSDCGQVMVAALAHVEVRDVTQFIGHDGGTNWDEIESALKHFHVAVGEPMAFNGVHNTHCILLLRNQQGEYHWKVGSTRDHEACEIHSVVPFLISNPKEYLRRWDEEHGIIHEKRYS